MALIVKDRVRETTTTTGTGTLTLIAPVTGFQSFSVIGNGNTTYYSIVDVATGAWEVGIGTYTSSGTTLSRDTVLESSTGGAKVSFSSGTKDVFCTYPAERSVSQADVGTDPNEIPLNQYLGSMAFQDRIAVNIGGGAGAFTTLTSTSDATINGVRVGRGGGSVATNTAVGASAINATATGASNTGVGYRALTANTSGAENTALGQDSLFTSSTGGLNSAVGFMSLYSVTTASSNTAVGHQAGFLITTGAKNTILGRYNGNQGGLDIRTLSNYVVLSDGDGNPRLYHNGTTIVIPSLPTSSAGLPTGGLWNDGGQ